jgi:DNA helicase-2/ATP-dependent DNA helicase PcrA
MTAAQVLGSTGTRIRDTADLVALLGVAYTDEQLAAVTAPLEPLVIVAGAGSGKTTVMAARVVWLVGTGLVAPERVLGLTFTNKAAGELGQRIRAALERLSGPAVPTVAERGPGAGRGSAEETEPGEPAVATYHSYAGRLIEEHGLRIGVEPHARLLADASRYQLAARVIRRAPGPFRTLTKSVTMLVDDLLALDAEVSEHLVDLADLRAHDRALPGLVARAGGPPSAGALQALAAAERRAELTDLVEAYRAAKRDRDLVDFGDQMRLAAALAQTCPEVGAAERATFGVVLLDEYQDTSVAQRLMLAGLFAGGHPVTAVGDPCQAIYGWRGASVANLEEFPQHFPRADGSPAVRLSLRENRRNGETILDLANGLAAPLRAIHQGVAPLLASAAARGRGELRASVHETYAEEVEWAAGQVQAALSDGVAADEIAVLVRVTRDIGPLHAALTARDIPVEVVGLGGLVHLPEVADLIALLEVLDDATANAALVRLLVGPRWRIGPRDLALLGRRAAELVRVPAGAAGRAPVPSPPEPVSALHEAVAGMDPVEIASLSDALADVGEAPFSAAARRRFVALDRELRELRRHVGEPLLDLLHRLATVTGLDVEIAAGPAAVAVRRRESLAAFLDVAASFNDLDGDSSVSAFLAYLRAAEEHERGLDSATPSTAESVKLMTAHKAKGLEWDVVVLPDVTADVFPSNRGRARWTTRGDSLPYPLRGDRDALPTVRDWSAKGLAAFADDLKELSRLEELRLAYVACTRPRRRLVVSAHWWGPTQKRRRGPSAYLEALRDFCRVRGIDAGGPWAPPPEDGAVNPCLGEVPEIGWPAPLEPAAHARRLEAVAMVRAAMAAPTRADAPSGGRTSEEQDRVAAWDRDLELLLAELRRGREPRREVELPASLSASQLLVLARDPDALARDLARPMPRAPVPQARRGTRFHAWVETLFTQQPLLDPADLPGAADHDLVEAEELEALKKAFLRSPYSERRPCRVEAPFALAVAGRVVRGRIDAVYETLDGFEVVDWKTNRTATADPLQLAVYRLAWAEIAGVDPERVSAAFLYVRSGKVVRPDPLPGRSQLEALLSGSQPQEA